jgi:hypothetical protein
MMLFMLAAVGEQGGGKLPANRAQLIQRFMTLLFDRERRKNPHQTDSRTKEELLGEVAFATRMAGKVAFSRDEFFRIVKQYADDRGFRKDGLAYLHEVLDNNLLEADGETLAFVHELYQEYFAATALKRRYERDPKIVDSLARRWRKWEAPLTLLYGLLESRASLFSQMVRHNLIVAARCLASEDQPAAEAVAEFENAINKIDFRAADRSQRRVILLALGVAGNACLLAEKLKVCRWQGQADAVLRAICLCENPLSMLVECVRREIQEHRASAGAVGVIMKISWARHLVIPDHVRRELLLEWTQARKAGLSGELLFALCRVFQLEGIMPVADLEDLVGQMIQAGMYGAAAGLVIRFDLTKPFPLEDLVYQMVEAGRCGSAAALMKDFNLTNTLFVERLVRQMIEAGRYEPAADWAKKYGITNTVLVRDLVRQMIAAGKYGAAAGWMMKCDLTDTFRPECLVRQMIEAGQHRAAVRWAKKLGVADKFFPGRLDKPRG